MNFYAFKVLTVYFVSNIWHVGLTLFIWLEKFRQEKSLWPNLSFLLFYFETGLFKFPYSPPGRVEIKTNWSFSKGEERREEKEREKEE